MPDITVMSVDQFDSPNGGGFCRARAGLGVSAFGMQVEHFPPNFEHFPEATLAPDGCELLLRHSGCKAAAGCDALTARTQVGMSEWYMACRVDPLDQRAAPGLARLSVRHVPADAGRCGCGFSRHRRRTVTRRSGHTRGTHPGTRASIGGHSLCR